MKDKKDKIIIVSILVFVFAFLFISKTVTSGYHFVDDHEVIKIKSDLKTSSLNSVARSWVLTDLKTNGRFRPFYYIHRVYETKLFGSDFFLWSVYNGLLWFLTMMLFYISMRGLKFSSLESVLFLVIVFIGPQSPVWWRLGPGESVGMVLLGLAFYFMQRSLNRRYYQIYNVLFIIFLILSSLTKESFLLIIPAVIVFKIWYERINFWSSVKESILKNFSLLLPVAVCIIELYIIKIYVGTGYADLNTDLLSNIRYLFLTTLHFLNTYRNLLVAGSVILIICLIIKKFPFKIELFPIIFFLLVFIPNLILYSKSWMSERYLLPTTFGLGYLVISVVRTRADNPAWLRKLVPAILLISFLPYIGLTISQALEFSEEGRYTNDLLLSVSTSRITGTDVLVIVDPVESYETSISLKTYLHYEDNIDLYGFMIVKDENNSDYKNYVDGWKENFKSRQYENLTSPPGLLVFLDKTMVDIFFQKSLLVRNNYTTVELGKSPFALLKENKPNL